jgi:hypothetical protein
MENNVPVQAQTPTPPPAPPTPAPIQVLPPLPGPDSLLHESWALYKKDAKQFVKIGFVTILASALPIMAVGAIVALLVLNNNNIQTNISLIVLLVIAILATIILIQFIFAWGYLAMISLVRESGPTTIRALWTKNKGLIVPYFWIGLLVGLITAGGYFFFIIPGIIFTIWFSFAVFILIDLDKKGLAALLTSKEYAKGYFIGIAVRLLILALVVGLLQVPIAIFSSVAGLLKLPAYYNGILSILYNIFSFFVVTPMSLIYSYKLYTAVKVNKGPVNVAVTASTKVKYGLVAAYGIIAPIVLFGLIMLGIVALFTNLQNSSVDTIQAPSLNLPDNYNYQNLLTPTDTPEGSY